MGELLERISKAVDVVADVLTGNTHAVKSASLYKYADFINYCKTIKQKDPRVQVAVISVERANEFEGTVFPEMKYVVKIVLMDEQSQPLSYEGDEEAYMGTVVVASTIDTQLREFMGDGGKKKVRIK